MKQKLQIIIPGPPVPAERVRATFLRGRGGAPVMRDGKPIVHVYTAAETAAYEDHVANVAAIVLRQNPWWIELSLSDVFFRMHLHVVTNRVEGDFDNYEKAILDGLKKANQYRIDPPPKGRVKPKKTFIGGIYRDDKRVRQCLTSLYSEPHELPRAEILIEPTSGILEEPLWMAVAREHGWGPEQGPRRDERDKAGAAQESRRAQAQ